MPDPAFLAPDAWEPDAVEKDLRLALDACGHNGTPLEFILKDVNTIRYDPRRLREWVEIARWIVRQVSRGLGRPLDGAQSRRRRQSTGSPRDRGIDSCTP
jgi:hypothetical protein